MNWKNALPGQITWPQKTREYSHNHVDSSVWNDFAFRDDDIIIATYGKSGTTWLQQIIAQLIFEGKTGVNVAAISPWVDFLLPPKAEKLAMLEAQTHRRFLKTHLPVNALNFSPKAKYIYIARDGRDVVWSFYNHHAKMTKAAYERLKSVCPPSVQEFSPPPDNVHTYYQGWMAKDGYPMWPFWENIASWWSVRDLPNVMVLHFNDLKADLPGQIRNIADFLDIEVDGQNWDAIIEHCGFDYMKKNAKLNAPNNGATWKGGARTFINKGTNGRWRETLSAEECAAYEAMAIERLGVDCAHWLATGQGPEIA